VQGGQRGDAYGSLCEHSLLICMSPCVVDPPSLCTGPCPGPTGPGPAPHWPGSRPGSLVLPGQGPGSHPGTENKARPENKVGPGNKVGPPMNLFYCRDY